MIDNRIEWRRFVTSRTVHAGHWIRRRRRW